VYTDQEHVSTPTFVQLAGTSMTIGAAASVFASTQSTSSYAVMFQGPAGELSDAQVLTLLTALGWSPQWTYLVSMTVSPNNNSVDSDGFAVLSSLP
jgi:hypothetical protein